MIKIALVISPGFQMMIFAALSVFEVANIVSGETLYDIQVLSEQGGAVQSSLGMPIETRAFSRPMFDTLVVGGLIDVKPPVSEGLLAFIRDAVPECRRVASICTGAPSRVKTSLAELCSTTDKAESAVRGLTANA